MFPAAERTESNVSQKVIAAGVVLGFLYMAGPLVMTVVISLLMASTLDPAVHLLARRGFPRGLAAMTTVLVVIGAIYLALNLLYGQAVNFADDLPKSLAALRGHVLRFREQANRFQRQTEEVISPREAEGPVLPAAQAERM